MATLTLRLPEDTQARLRQVAQQRLLSRNQLREELALLALTRFDAEPRFRAGAARGSVQAGLRLLDKLDAAPRAGRNRCTIRRGHAVPKNDIGSHRVV